MPSKSIIGTSHTFSKRCLFLRFKLVTFAKFHSLVFHCNLTQCMSNLGGVRFLHQLSKIFEAVLQVVIFSDLSSLPTLLCAWTK